ncbi:MAG: hypothetical protein RR386_04340 [Bacteroidaceae bacterium]
MRLLKIYITSCLMVCATTFVTAQTITWEDFVEQITAEEFNEEETQSEQQQTLDELVEIHQQPFDINSVDSLDLLRLPFLSGKEISALLRYRNKNAPLLTLGELQLIGSLSGTTRQYLSLFLKCDPIKQKTKWFATNANEVATRIDVPLYQRAGYRSYTAKELAHSPNKAYLGNALYTSLRYRYNSPRLQYGITAEKDAGEPFFAKGNTTFDAYHFYLFGKTSGLLHTWALGDYRVHFGQGLVIGTGYMNNGLSVLMSKQNASEGIRKHSSTDEVNYLRGAATSLRIGHVKLTALVSFRKLDATLRGDSVVSSFPKNGYHRTPLEWSKKNNIRQLTLGSNLKWNTRLFQLGATAMYHSFDTPIVPSSQRYNRYRMRGKTFFNVSADYGLHYRNISWNGEVATSQKGGMAMLNTLRYTLGFSSSLFLLQRAYSFRYVSPSSYSYTTGGSVQNEQGLMIGTTLRLYKQLQFTGYVDVYRFPWATFRVASAPSEGFRGFVQIVQQFRKHGTLLLRYQVKCWQQDLKKHTQPARFYRHTVRTQFTQATDKWSFVSALNGVLGLAPNQKNQMGWAVSERISYKPRKQQRLAAMFAYFHTDDYDTRIYIYEPNVLYASAFPTCYYHGLRCVALGTVGMGRHFEVSARYTLTHYFDRETIGSGTQQIFAPSKNDLSFQLRYTF